MAHGRDIKSQSSAAEQELEHLLLAIDQRIAVTSAEYTEAKERLHVLTSVLSKGFESRVYINGSIAHGDALSPLNDVDLGVILGEPWATTERHHSPIRIMKHACEVIETLASEYYPGLSADFTGQKRAVVVRFGSDARKQRYEFTADVIVALDCTRGSGVFIPNLQRNWWDRSDPIKHSEMIRQANSATDSSFNAVVRVVKQWNRKAGQPLSSWNIKALALSCILRPMPLLEGVHSFFYHARESLNSGLTPDPAGIGAPIGLEREKDEVLACLDDACEVLDQAIKDAISGNLPASLESIQGLFPTHQIPMSS
ncbi:hypothetical protein [Streptomyces sp. NPDC052127]|uniref:hypothetical protein n=1 Tax=Streptomyces sp. NPDC052127 TaxID=3155679 RepID=UPI0034408C61